MASVWQMAASKYVGSTWQVQGKSMASACEWPQPKVSTRQVHGKCMASTCEGKVTRIAPPLRTSLRLQVLH